jgi:sn-glycerol 3-phosphate transport system substrate-binding protein
MGGNNGKEVQKLVDQFNNGEGKKENIIVKPIFQGSYSDLMQKYKAAYQSHNAKNLPDLVQIPSDSTGYIKDVKETVWAKDIFKRDSNLKQANFLKNSVNQFSFKGEQIGIPFASSSILMYYNKTDFNEVGLDPKQPPKTIKELGEFSAKLYKKNGNQIVRYGLELEPSWYQLTSWIGMQSSNKNSYSYIGDNKSGRSAAMTKVTFDKDGTMKKFLEAYVPAIKGSNSKYIGTTDYNDFIAGTNAIYIGSSAAIGGISSGVGKKFEWSTAYLPKVSEDDKGGVAPGGSALYAMNRGDDASLNSVCRFIEYLTSANIQLDWSKNTGYFPTNVKTYDLPEFKEYLSTNPYFSLAVDQLRSSNLNVQEAISGCSGDIGKAIDNNIVSAIQGKIDIDTAIKNMSDASDKAINDYNRANE